MAIFRPGVRKGALAASQQGNLGGFLAAHPRAQQQWNRAAQGRQGAAMGGGVGRQQMLGGRNDQALANNLTLGQASGGQPAPMPAGPSAAGGLGGLPGGGMSPQPPTTQYQPPGAMGGGPQYTTLGGMQSFGAGGASQMPNFQQYMQQMRQQEAMYPGSTMLGQMGGQIGGLIGSVNPGMQSVIGNRLQGMSGAYPGAAMSQGGGSVTPYGGMGQMGPGGLGQMQNMNQFGRGMGPGGYNQYGQLGPGGMGGMQQPSYRMGLGNQGGSMMGQGGPGYGYGAGNAGQPQQRWQQLGATPM